MERRKNYHFPFHRKILIDGFILTIKSFFGFEFALLFDNISDGYYQVTSDANKS
jgi:hypothetical protein